MFKMWDSRRVKKRGIIMRKCPYCGSILEDEAKFCDECGAKVEKPLVEQQSETIPSQRSPKINMYESLQMEMTQPANKQRSRLVAGLLAIFFGGLGLHSFYLKNVKLGIAHILTNFVCGIGGIWGIIDGIRIFTGKINTDAKGIPLKTSDKKKEFVILGTVVGVVVIIIVVVLISLIASFSDPTDYSTYVNYTEDQIIEELGYEKNEAGIYPNFMFDNGNIMMITLNSNQEGDDGCTLFGVSLGNSLDDVKQILEKKGFLYIEEDSDDNRYIFRENATNYIICAEFTDGKASALSYLKIDYNESIEAEKINDTGGTETVEFQDGVSDTYEAYSFQMDTNKIIDEFHDRGFEYVWLTSHEVSWPEDGQLGDIGTSDVVYLDAAHIDENGYYYVTEEYGVLYNYFGEGIGWANNLIELQQVKNYSFDGFNDTYWKIGASGGVNQIALYLFDKYIDENSDKADIYLSFSEFENFNDDIIVPVGGSDREACFYADHPVGTMYLILNGEVFSSEINLWYSGIRLNHSVYVENEWTLRMDIASEISKQKFNSVVINYPKEQLERFDLTLVDKQEFDEALENASAVQAEKTHGADTLSFSDMSGQYVMSSGAGGWATYFDLDADGAFTGQYYDFEMGDSAEEYPNGTIYLCNFSGTFSELEQIDEYVYSLHLDSLMENENPGKVEYEDGVRYIYDEAYGLNDANDFLVYCPGIPIEKLPEDFLIWANTFVDTETTEILPSYGIYCETTENGFVEDNFVDTPIGPAMSNSNDYILPDSSTRYLDESDLQGLTSEELRIARNEIYARHGRIFQSEDLQNYFESKEWYSGVYNAESFSEDTLSEIEKYNRDLIVNYEKNVG